MGNHTVSSNVQSKRIKTGYYFLLITSFMIVASMQVQAHTQPNPSHRLIALKAPNVPLNSPLLDSFRNDSGQHSPHHRLLRSHHWPVRNRLYNSEPQHGMQDSRGFGPSLNSPYTVDPNGPNGPGMPGGSPLY